MHEIKRASLERDFMHRPSADGVINIHTTRHKSSTQLKHTPKRHHPALRMQCRRRAFVWRLTTWWRRSQPYSVLLEGVRCP